MTPYRHQCFGEIYCLHLQGRRDYYKLQSLKYASALGTLSNVVVLTWLDLLPSPRVLARGFARKNKCRSHSGTPLGARKTIFETTYLQDSQCTYKVTLLPLKRNNTFPLYRFWRACSCQQCKTAECCHGNARMGSLYTVVELQNVSYCCLQYKRTYVFM
jgi:hypothetical protein